MNGLNVSLINNRVDALRYIVPVTDAEKVLYCLLMDADYDLDKLDQYEKTVEELTIERDYLKIDLENAQDEIEALKAEIAEMEHNL